MRGAARGQIIDTTYTNPPSSAYRPLARGLALLLGSFALIAISPPSSHGATAAVNTVARSLTFMAAPGELNDVAATRSHDDVTLVDPGAPIAPGPGCSGGGAAGVPVVCSVAGPGSLFALELRLGNGDDAADLTGIDNTAGAGSTFLTLEVFGEEGGDDVTGGPGRDEVTGGGGDDTASGGGDEDNFFAGAGPDGVDTYHGDAGNDFVNYEARSAPVAVSLDGAANDGAPGEGDNADTEGVVGGAAGDTLLGGAGANILHAGGGPDQLEGFGGDDELDGGEDGDTLLAGGGNDRVFGSNGRDHARGAAGDDTMLGGPNHDTLAGAGGDDDLRGLSGDDLLLAGAGADDLLGDLGFDDLRGGPGDDSIDSFSAFSRPFRDRARDLVHCGTEFDDVLADTRDRLRDCESVTIG